MEYYYQPNMSSEKCERADRLAYMALSEVAIKYGSGYEDDNNRPEVHDLAYHNLQHSWRVKDAAERLAKKLGLSEDDILLTGMIAAAHDVVHEPADDKTPERLSAEWLMERMNTEGFSEEDQAIACLVIQGTATIVDTNGDFIGQQFPLIGFPDERAGTIALCIAAADMEAAYANYGPAVIHDYFKELQGYGYAEIPTTLDGLVEFQETEVKFLENLQPLFKGMEQLLGGLKQEGIAHHTALLEELRAGRITTWVEVQQFDNDFMQRHK